MPATHSPTPARSWIVRLARVCWERKKLSIIVVVASVSTILLAALTPLLTRQAVNDALAGNPTRLPWLACGLLLIAFFDFIGNYVRRGYAGELSLWVQHTLRGRAFDSIQKLDGAGQDALRTGQVISRTNSDLQQVHTLLQMCPVPLAVFTYYIAGIAVDVTRHDAHRRVRTGMPGYHCAARASPGLCANRAGLGPTGKSHRTYARGAGADLSGKILRGGAA